MTCFIQMKVKQDVREGLKKLKIHPRQSYNEIIEILINEHNLKQIEEHGME